MTMSKKSLLIAYCQKCGAKSAGDNIFCSNCGAKIVSSMAENRVPNSLQERSDIRPEAGTYKKKYRDQTMTLRMATVTVWYGMFISLMPATIYLLVMPVSIFFTAPFIALEIWIAKNLGRYNNKARITLIIISFIVVILSILSIFFLGNTEIYIFALILMGMYQIYAMLIHTDTIELFHGDYQQNPDYTVTASSDND